MSMLPTCPRCGSYVESDWLTCKICGFDPQNSLTHGSFALPTGPKVKKLQPMDIVTAGFGIFLIAVFLFASVSAVSYLLSHRTSLQPRQYFVTVAR